MCLGHVVSALASNQPQPVAASVIRYTDVTILLSVVHVKRRLRERAAAEIAATRPITVIISKKCIQCQGCHYYRICMSLAEVHHLLHCLVRGMISLSPGPQHMKGEEGA